MLKWLVLYLLNDSKHPIVVLLSTNFGSCVWFSISNLILVLLTFVKLHMAEFQVENIR